MKHTEPTELEPRMTAESVYEIPVVPDEANNNNHSNNNNETRENLDENGFTIPRGTPIQDFYAGQSVFITGGTGFLGKLLIEKLLRSCPQISTIYMLVRSKKDKNVEDRIEDLFNNPVYDRLREVLPKFRHKIVGIPGDCTIRGLGISSTDRERLLREVSIVFHSAATVRFDERMNTALAINVRSTMDMIELCKRMDRLKVFIHVSTAYANCHLETIEETFYPHVTKLEELERSLEGLNDREIREMTPKIINAWPNTYTFTKALAEAVVKEHCKGLTTGIFRPGIVISSAYEPIPGWTDNFYGPTGAVAAVASGVLRSIQFSPTSRANVVPVDFTVNALLASAWDVANQPDRRDDKMLIYNYVSTRDIYMTWESYVRTNMVHAREYPLSDAQWTVSLTIHNNKISSKLGRLFLHIIPAVFVDFYRVCRGYPPKLLKTYKRVHKFVDVITWFCTNDWEFTNDNVMNMWHRLDAKDQQLFLFNMKDLQWYSYFRNYLKGLRVFLLKDDLSTLEASRKQAKRYIWMHETMVVILLTCAIFVIWQIVSAVFF